MKNLHFFVIFAPKPPHLQEKHTYETLFQSITTTRQAPGNPRHCRHSYSHLAHENDAKIQNSIQTHKPGTEKRLLYLIYIKKNAIDTQRQTYPPKSKIDRTISLLCLFCVVFRKSRKNFCKLVRRWGHLPPPALTVTVMLYIRHTRRCGSE
mgnify:CR=1 FL=1